MEMLGKSISSDKTNTDFPPAPTAVAASVGISCQTYEKHKSLHTGEHHTLWTKGNATGHHHYHRVTKTSIKTSRTEKSQHRGQY